MLLLVLTDEGTEVQGRERLAQGHVAGKSQKGGLSDSRAHALFCLPAVSEPEPQVSVWVTGSHLLAVRAAQQGYFWHRPGLLSDSCYIPVSLEFEERKPTPGVGKGSLRTHFFWFLHTENVLIALITISRGTGTLKLSIIFIKVTKEKGRREAQFGRLKEYWIHPVIGGVEVGNNNVPRSTFSGRAFDFKCVRHVFLITLCLWSLF